MLGEARIKLWPLAVPPAAAAAAGRSGVGQPLAPGELRVQRTSVLAGTATEPVELGDVQPTGQAADARRGLGPRPAPDGRGAGLRWRPGVGRAAAASSVASSRPVVTSAVASSAASSVVASSAAASSAAAVRRVAARGPRPAGRGAPTRPAARPSTC